MVLTNLLDKLAAYVPAPVAQAIYENPRLLTEPTAQRFDAAVLFSDISGFTHLSELLGEAGATGSEELTYLINQYFSRMIETIQNYHGQVVKFSGDALTVIFPAKPTLAQAVHYAGECALAMQTAMTDFTNIQTSRGPASFSMKVAIGAGEILECSVGGALGRWEYLVAGDPLVQVATAEHQAQPGQIILSPQAWHVAASFFRGDIIPHSEGFVILVEATTPLDLPELPVLDWTRLSPDEQLLAEKALQCYVPGAVKVRLNEQSEWLAELRRMTIVFVGIGGFDYHAAHALERVQKFLQAVQEMVYSFEGALNKVAVDDKGTMLLLLFGAPPFSHEDDATRAVACALSLRDVAAGQNLRTAIGIAEGQIFAGPVGSARRREYTVIGDQVNLAARLMQHAAAHEIIISERVKERAGPHFMVENLGLISIKGKAQTLPAHKVIGEQRAQDEFVIRHLLNEDFLIGRETELELFGRMAARTREGLLQILFIEGELGVGKSRLATEIVREWVINGGVGYGSTCASYGRQTPYQAWREVLEDIHGISPNFSSQQIFARLERGIADLVDPPDEPDYWKKRAPLLAEAMGLEPPDNNFTRDISGQLRRNNTFALIEAILRRQAERHALLLLLENIQWADELSLALIEYLTTTLTDMPVFLVLIHRPMTENPWPKLAEIRDLPYSQTVCLEPLSADHSHQLLNLLLNERRLVPAAMDKILSRTQGNPFFLQEIARSVLGTVHQHNGHETEFELPDLPDTIQDVILSRVDRLPEETAKVTLKVASVIGTAFARSLLFEVHPSQVPAYEIAKQLEKLEAEKLIRLESPSPKWEYVFHNVVTQEVVYEGLLLAQRRQLHSAVGDALENLNPEAVEQLAYHYNRSTNIEKALHYLAIAAQKSQREYATQAAIEYYTAIIELFPSLPGADGRARGIVFLEYWNYLIERAKLYNLVGQRDNEIEDLGTLGIVAEALDDDRCRAVGAKQWAYLYGTQGDYESGVELIQRAVELATKVGDEKLLGEAYNYWGHLLYLRLEYETAHQYFQNTLRLAQKHQDKHAQADSLNSLGMVALYQMDFEVALYFFEETISLWHELGNQVGLANSLNYLGLVDYRMGEYSEALRVFNQALALHRTIGDRAGEAASRYNLGLVYHSLGNYETASQLFEKALTLHQSIGDRRGQAGSFYQLGFLHHRLGDYSKALVFLDEALSILREVHDPWALGKTLTYYGWTLSLVKRWEEAENYLVEALQVDRELQQQPAVIEEKALLAALALAQQDLILADAYTQEILSYLELHGTHGMEHPAMVYLSCYYVLQDNQQLEQAKTLLQQAWQLISQKSTKIDDAALQESYRNQVPEHKTIQELLQQ